MFSVKDVVNVPGRRDLAVHGVIQELRPDSRALICFNLPRHPKESSACDECGSFQLSQNGATGEVVCMRTGCGHEHGFDKREEVISLDLLVNITKKRREKDQADLLERITGLLHEGVEKKILTPEISEQVLQVIKI